MSQNQKIFVIFLGLLLLGGVIVFSYLKPRKIISPSPENLDVSVMFSPKEEKPSPTKTPTLIQKPSSTKKPAPTKKLEATKTPNIIPSGTPTP